MVLMPGPSPAGEVQPRTSLLLFDGPSAAAATRLDDLIHFLSRVTGILALGSAITIGLNLLL